MTFYQYLKEFTETYLCPRMPPCTLREAYCVEVMSRYGIPAH